MQNPDYKDKIRILDADLLGKHKRINKSSYASGWGKGNYALRTDWLCADKLRAVLGKYYTVYNRPAAYPGQQSIKNYGALNAQTPGWNWDQVKNAPLTFNFWQSTTAGPRYIIRLNNHKWNALAHNNATRDFLRYVEYGDETAGNPNWRFFLEGRSPAEVAAGLEISGRFSNVTPVFQNPGPFTDNTFYYLKPSNITEQRQTSGMQIDVVSTYNFYADTTPPYEDAISTLPEPLLPNFYCMESELRNTGSTPNALDYIRQIKMDVPSRTAPGTTLNPNYLRANFPLDDWFDEVTSLGVSAGWTESTGDEFYSLYAASANSVANSPQMSDIRDDSAEFKNCVILCSDLKGLNKLAAGDTKSTGLINVPFYNTLTLGLDEDAMSPSSHGDLGNDNFFSRLKADQYNGQSEMFKSFMDILQMYIIQKIEGSPTPLSAGRNYKKWKKARVVTPGEADRNEWTVTDASDIYGGGDFSWSGFLDATNPTISAQHAGNTAVSAADRINLRDTSAAYDNLLLLRDYNSKIEEELLLVDADVADCSQAWTADADGTLVYPTRNFNSVLRGESCYSEPILYKIDKFLIPPGRDPAGTTAGQVVQTFYISARDGDWQQPLGGINYIDTQIKYGRKYKYEIKQIRLVYGNRYKYVNPQLYYTNVPADNTRGIGRALGIYRDPGLSRWDGTSTDPDHLEVTDDIITELVDPDAYTAWNENPSPAPEQESYFIFRPTQQAFAGSQGQTVGTTGTDTMFQYLTLFNEGSNLDHPKPPINTTTPVTFTGASAGSAVSAPALTSTNVLDGIKLQVVGSAVGAGDQMVGVKLEYFANILERPPAGAPPITPGGTQGALPPPSSGGSAIPSTGPGQVLGSGPAPSRDPPPGVLN